MKLRYLIACLALTLALPASADAYSYGNFKVSLNISEDLAWSVPSQTIECGTYIGAGRTSFSFKSKKASKVIVNSSVVGSLGQIKGGGLQSGSMAVYKANDSCITAKDLVQPTSGCGKMSFAPEFSFKNKGGSTYLTSLTGTGDYDDKNFDCAYFQQISGFPEGGINSCGLKEDPIREIHNQALRDIGAEGITSVKYPFTPKSLLKIKKGKKKTFAKNFSVKCSALTERGFSVVFDGKVKSSLTFKRVS